MMNSTMKIVRGRIEEHHRDLMEYLYMPEAKSIHHPRNVEAMKRLLEKK
jgi:long-chain acyl-CoA synthetase